MNSNSPVGQATMSSVVVLALHVEPSSSPSASTAAVIGSLTEPSLPAGVHVTSQTERTLIAVIDEGSGCVAVDLAVRGLAVATRTGGQARAALVAGNLVRIETEDVVQYVGATLERAPQLADIAAAGTILLDDQSARLTGATAAPRPLLSETRSVVLDGEIALAYHELFWEHHGPGMLAAASQPPSRSKEAREAPAEGEPSSPERLSRWLRGAVMRIGPKFGFIEDQNGCLYYFQQRNLTVDLPVRRGMRVIFRALPPARGTQEKRAEDIFVIDSMMDGVLERVNPKGWGLLKLDCHNGLEHRLYLPNVGGRGFGSGQRLRCRIGANELGPLGYQVEVATELPPTRAPEPAVVTT